MAVRKNHVFLVYAVVGSDAAEYASGPVEVVAALDADQAIDHVFEEVYQPLGYRRFQLRADDHGLPTKRGRMLKVERA